MDPVKRELRRKLGGLRTSQSRTSLTLESPGPKDRAKQYPAKLKELKQALPPSFVDEAKIFSHPTNPHKQRGLVKLRFVVVVREEAVASLTFAEWRVRVRGFLESLNIGRALVRETVCRWLCQWYCVRHGDLGPPDSR